MKNLFVLLLLCPLLLVWGQEKNQSTQKEKQVAEAQAAVDATQSQLEAQILPGEAFYNAQGRRDPFVNLLLGRNVRENRQAIEGLPGLLIDELELEGIVSVKKGVYLALMKGPDTRPYQLNVGDKVYDGEVVAINRNSISFKKSLTVALGGQKEKVVIKSLNPEEEEIKK